MFPRALGSYLVACSLSDASATSFTASGVDIAGAHSLDGALSPEDLVDAALFLS